MVQRASLAFVFQGKSIKAINSIAIAPAFICRIHSYKSTSVLENNKLGARNCFGCIRIELFSFVFDFGYKQFAIKSGRVSVKSYVLLS